MAEIKKLNTKDLLATANKYFKENPDERTVFISEDGQCFGQKQESAAKHHAAQNGISVNSYNK